MLERIRESLGFIHHDRPRLHTVGKGHRHSVPIEGDRQTTYSPHTTSGGCGLPRRPGLSGVAVIIQSRRIVAFDQRIPRHVPPHGQRTRSSSAWTSSVATAVTRPLRRAGDPSLVAVFPCRPPAASPPNNDSPLFKKGYAATSKIPNTHSPPSHRRVQAASRRRTPTWSPRGSYGLSIILGKTRSGQLLWLKVRVRE